MRCDGGGYQRAVGPRSNVQDEAGRRGRKGIGTGGKGIGRGLPPLTWMPAPSLSSRNLIAGMTEARMDTAREPSFPANSQSRACTSRRGGVEESVAARAITRMVS